MSEPSLFFRSLGEPGPGGTLVFLHATGLNASAYLPLLKAIDFDGQILAVSLRGHGATTLPADPAMMESFWVFANDVMEELAQHKPLGPLTLAGHSAGAVSAMLAARELRPRSLLMLEPVAPPDWIAMLARSPLKPWTVGQMPIAKAAARRRASFSSVAEARKAYAQKSFFKGWDPAALDGYVEEGFRPDGEGGVALACTPAFEAATFAAQGHGFWPHLPIVARQGTRVSILACAEGSTFPKAVRGKARRLGAEVTDHAGGHMLPLEAVQEVAAWMTKHASVPTGV